ncbi:MAG: VOC family protein [Actinomycetota bacterium]
MAVKPIPDGYPKVTPYLHVDGAAGAIEFYKNVFGATERMQMAAPGGKVAHAELELGDSLVMLADESPDMGIRGPSAYGGSPVMISVYVEDVDGTYRKALDAGAKSVSELENQFYGDRTAQFEDPFGHRWHIAQHVEDVPPGEMERRAAEAMGAMGGGEG